MGFDLAAIFVGIKTSLGALTESQSASVLRERILLIQDQMKLVEKVAAQSEEKSTDLEIQVKKLEEELAAYRIAEQFTEHEGALFKRKPTGGYVRAVYCPRCKTSTGSVDATMPFYCGACKWSSGFMSGGLDRVIAGIGK